MAPPSPPSANQLFFDTSALPDVSSTEINFPDTSFFNPQAPCPPQLPAPSTILEQHPKTGSSAVVKYEDLNLVVKYGNPTCVRLEEAQTMRAVRGVFPNNEVPVPELYGWRQFEGQNFIYMSLIAGKTLREAWPTLTEVDKESILDDLKRIVVTLRQVTHGPHDPFIGSISRGPVLDRFFRDGYLEGPFATIESFNDWYLAAATRTKPGPDDPTRLYRHELYRDLLPDTGRICFTHGDLTLGNIMVSGEPGSQRIAAIIDWEQAGWYPEYWECCKLQFGVEEGHEWLTAGWPEKITEPFEDAMWASGEYRGWHFP